MPTDSRTPLVLISGLATTPAIEFAERFLAQPGTAVVEYNLRQVTEGVVTRRLRLGQASRLSPLELAHGCVSCTLRHDMLPLLRKLSRRPGVRRIAVRLDEAMEPEPVCYAMQEVLVGGAPVDDFVRLDAVYTVIDRGSWFDAATGDDLLADHNLIASPEDERTLAQLAISQVEFADVLVEAGREPDTWTAARTNAVLGRVAAAAPRVPLSDLDAAGALARVPDDARRGELTDMHGSLLRGQPPLHDECGVTTVLFGATRPFHPERLHEAIDVLLDGVVRAKGRAWVASQPDAALWVESAGGGLGIGHAGPWLTSPDGPGWDEVSDERRALASLRWHPRFGDRAQELVIVAHRATATEIETAMTNALLTDAELAAGEQAWLRYPDPFGEWHTDPCEGSEVPDNRTDAFRTDEQ